MFALHTRNAVYATAGLTALAACILACTSFSPDDRQILYPSFDPASGALSVSLYDRPSGKSRQVFVLGATGTKPDDGFPVPRAQWLPDGKRFVVAWTLEPEAKDETGIASFALVPIDSQDPVRVMHLTAHKDAVQLYLRPLPMIGQRVFAVSESDLLSLDLVSGELSRKQMKEPLALLLAPFTNRLGYVQGLEADSSLSPDMELGLLDPDSMDREWRLRTPRADLLSVAFSPVGKKLAYIPDRKQNDSPRLVVLEEGKPARDLILPATTGETLRPGYCLFDPKGDVLFASFTLQTNGAAQIAFGFVEVPLDGATPRRTVLIRNLTIKDPDQANPTTFFEFGLSHDGKTLAVSSAGIALVSPEMKAEDCALFLVDLTEPGRKTRKIAIPLPPNHVFIKD